MAVSETVQLRIEIVDAREGVRILTDLNTQTERLKGSFASAEGNIRQFTGRTKEEFTGLNQFLQKSTTQFRETASGLVIPKSVAAETEATANKVEAAVKKVTRASKGLGAQRGRTAEINKRANLLLIDVGRGAQDAAFGLRAVINNLDPIILNFERFQKSVAASNNGVVTFTNSVRALNLALSSPAGILLLINLLFTFASLTGFLLPISEFFTPLAKSVLGLDTELKKLAKDIATAAKEASILSENLTPIQALRTLEEVEGALERLQTARTNLQVERFGLTFATLGFGELSQTQVDTLNQIEQLRVAIEGLEVQRDELRKVRVQIDSEIALLFQGSAQIISRREQKVVNAIDKASRDLLRLRSRGSRDNITLQRQLAEEETEERIEAIERERALILSRLEIIADERQRFLVASQRALSAEIRRQNAQAVANADRFLGVLFERIVQFDALIEAEREATQSEFAQRAADLARTIERQIIDAQLIAARERLNALGDETETRIAILELERDRRLEVARRALEDFKGVGEDRIEFERAIEAQRLAITTQTEVKIADIRQRAFDQEQDRGEQRIQQGERITVALGGQEEVILRNRLDRINSFILQAENGSERERRLISERVAAELILQRFLDAQAQREARRTQQAALRLERFAAQVQEVREQAAVEAGTPLLDVLAQRAQRLRAELDVAARAATRVAALEQEVQNIQTLITRVGRADQERLKERLDILNRQLESARQAEEDVLDIQLDLLDAEREVAAEEQRIFEARIEAAQAFTRRLVATFFEALEQTRRLGDAEVAFRKDQFRIQQNELQISLNKRKISEEEFNIKLARLTEQRAEFQKRVEQERFSFVERLQRGVAELIRQTGEQIIADLAAAAVRSIATALFASQAAKAIVIPTMVQIAAAGSPAATVVSIATFGAAAAAGEAAVIAALLSTSGVVRALQATAFQEGGYTGPGSSESPAGIVHAGEFVMPADAVQGRTGALYALMSALQAGMDPNTLLGLVALQGFRASPFGVLRSAGIGFQTGGLVQAQSLLGSPGTVPVVGSDVNTRILETQREMAQQIVDLTQAVLALAQRPLKVAVQRRESRVVAQEAQQQNLLVTPSGK